MYNQPDTKFEISYISVKLTPTKSGVFLYANYISEYQQDKIAKRP